MQKDKILEMFFDNARWEYAIEKGVGKGVCKAELLQLTKPDVRIAMYRAIRDGNYMIAPPHTAKIPKDTPGEYRTVYVNEAVDRVFLSIANDLLFDLTPEMIHPRCTSYQRGIGCGKVVKDISKRIKNTQGDVIGFKADLSKYFDSVPIEYIDKAFDEVERKHGHSAVIDVLRKYYHSDIYFDSEQKELVEHYQSLKQGCSVASWLADVILYHIDEKISMLDVEYVRYSDDILAVGKDWQKAKQILGEELAKMQMKLNPKKVEDITHTRSFKFLGFSIKNDRISISSTRLKTFQKEIESRTIRKKTTYEKALNAVNRYLYRGNGEFSWATQILPVINIEHDIHELNKFVMDALRAVKTGKHRIGGLGYVCNQADGVITRGKGRNVKANREKVPQLDGYYSIKCMQDNLNTCRAVYDSIVNMM